MTESNFDQKLFRFMMVAIIVVAIVWMGVSVYKSFQPRQQEKFIFEVVGITNSTNATTLVSLHYDCIKFCADRFWSSDSSSRLKDCWEQCKTLGRETQ